MEKDRRTEQRNETKYICRGGGGERLLVEPASNASCCRLPVDEQWLNSSDESVHAVELAQLALPVLGVQHSVRRSHAQQEAGETAHDDVNNGA